MPIDVIDSVKLGFSKLVSESSVIRYFMNPFVVAGLIVLVIVIIASFSNVKKFKTIFYLFISLSIILLLNDAVMKEVYKNKYVSEDKDNMLNDINMQYKTAGCSLEPRLEQTSMEDEIPTTEELPFLQ